MKKKLAWSLMVGLVLMLSVSANLVAKSDNTPENVDVAFPGLVLEIISVEIPADRVPVVKFSIEDDNGRPLDREGVFTPGEVDIRYMLTYIPMGEEQKVTYHARGRDRDGVYTMIEMGTYTYKFGDTVLPEDYEKDATHTLAVAGRRELEDEPYFLEDYHSTQIEDWVPSGASEPMPRDIVTMATCNRCHQDGIMAGHFRRYKEVSACTQCHNPDYTDDYYSFDSLIHAVHAGNDPDIGELHYPVHEDYAGGLRDCEVCHTGGTPTEEFPLVAGPNPMPACEGSGAGETTLSWQADGKVNVMYGDKLFATSDGDGSQATGKWVHDGDVFTLEEAASGNTLQELTVNTTVFGCANTPQGTFRGEAGLLHTNWMTRPARAACGGCHDDVDFTGGGDHPAQDNDDSCQFCHEPDSGEEYDLSVTGAHTVFYKSNQLPGLLPEVKEVEFTAPGNKLRVTFSLRDRFGNFHPSELDQLNFRITGPNEDYDVYIAENATMSDLVADGQNWVYRFSTPIPLDAEGSYSLSIDGRAEVTVEKVIGDPIEDEDQMQNVVYPFAVTDVEAVPRRMVVDDAKCEDCHANLSLHGTNRNEAQYCNVCHRAEMTDEARRLPATGPDVGIHFNYMIHNIHMGAESYVPYTVYGYGSNFHDYGDVHYPGDLRKCDACHSDVNRGGRNPDPKTYWLPLPDGVLDTVAPSDYWSPLQPAAATCMSCHDYPSTASHIDLQTGDFGESCDTCHADGKTYSAEAVHGY